MVLGLLWFGLSALAGTVTMDGSTWQSVQPERIDEPKEEGFRATAVRRSMRVWRDKTDGPFRIEVSWTLDAQKRSWLDSVLAGTSVRVEQVTWNGRAGPISAGDLGARVTGFVDGPVEVRLVGTLEGDPTRDAVALELMPGVRGDVRVEVPDWRPELEVTGGDAGPPVSRGGGRFVTGASRLTLRLVPPQPPASSRPTLVVASVGIGLTVGDADVRGRAHVEYQVRQGEVSSVTLSVQDVGSDLVVTGPGMSSFVRNGNQVDVQLQAPVRDRVALDLSFSVDVPRGDSAVVRIPTISPQGAFRVESALQIARDGELEAVPDASSWTPVPAAALPDWSRGLVEGAPMAAYTTSLAAPGGQIDVFRFTPVEAPAVMVDVAGYTIALERDGHALVRVQFQVRNERAANLRLTPPPGMKAVGARVAGEPASPAEDDDGAWLIPLKRSLETVEGLLSFPVEVLLVGDGPDWEQRFEGSIPLPRVDAPVAVQRVTLHLPPGYESLDEVGEHERVQDFTEGASIEYGFAVGDPNAAKADQLFQEAVQAWMGNEFDRVEAQLEELKNMGASNENISRLESNLKVLDDESAGGDVALARRVKEQARARASEDTNKQNEYLMEGQSSSLSGDYEAAAESYKKAAELGEKLAKIEQAESVEQDVLIAESNARMAAASSAAQRAQEERMAQDMKEEAKKLEIEKYAKAEEQAKEAQWGQSKASKGTGSSSLQLRGEGKGGAGTGDVPELVVVEDEQILFKPEIEAVMDGRWTVPEGAHAIATGQGTLGVLDPSDGYSFESQGLGESADGAGLFGRAGGEEGGVVGGVEGGVVGGVLGGVAGTETTTGWPVTATPYPPDTDYDGIVDEVDIAYAFGGDEDSGEDEGERTRAGHDEPIEVESTARATTITKEDLEHIPTGRSYQSSTQSVAGVVVAKRRGGLSVPNPFRMSKKPAPEQPVLSGKSTVENDYRDDVGRGPTTPEKGKQKAADDPNLGADYYQLDGLEIADKPADPMGAKWPEAKPPKAPKEPPPRPMSAPELEPLQVGATELSVVVPAIGERVLYQHLLLAANAPAAVQVTAKKSPKKPRSTP